MKRHLALEFAGRVKRGEGVIVGLPEQFHRTRGDEGAQGLQNIGPLIFHLLEHDPGEGEGETEAPRGAIDQVTEQPGDGQIALFGQPSRTPSR